MNNVVLYPAESVMAQGTAGIAVLAGATMRLFKTTLQPAFGTTAGDVLANEADFSGYPPGGIALGAFQGPALAPGTGSYIVGPTVQFVRDGTLPGVNNVIGGWAVITAGGLLWVVGTFPEEVPMQVPNQACPVFIALGFPSG